MIGTLFSVVSIFTKVAVGCVKLTYSAAKLAYKTTKALVKSSRVAAKLGKKLGKGVAQTINKSRVMVRDQIPSPDISRSQVFNKPSRIESLIASSTKNKDIVKKSTIQNNNRTKKSHLFTKE